MENTLSILKSGLVSALLASSLACGTANKAPEESSNVTASNATSGTNSSSNSTNETAVKKQDAKTICAYLPAFKPGEYRQSSGSTFSCFNTNFATLPSGRPQNYAYTALGSAESVERVVVSMLTDSKHADAAQADEYIAEAGNELWQKVFSAPLPSEIKEAILADKGKAVSTTKKFTQPTAIAVFRSTLLSSPNAGNYSLTLDITLPK